MAKETIKYKEMNTLAIHDISGVGKCSLTVALPVLSACGVETAVLPTAVLSTHTGGFKDYVFVDLTDEMLPFAEHWKNENCSFSSVYTGFLGSVGQIEIVEKIIKMFRKDGFIAFVDPVMGDNGKLYPTYTDEMAEGVSRLVKSADIVMPNMTEASRILGIPYNGGPYEEAYVIDVLKRLCALGPKKAVLTGITLIGDEGRLGSACYDATLDKAEFTLLERIDGYFHGTGDLFGSTVTAAVLNGMNIFEATVIATEYTWRSIVSTKEHQPDYKFGPKFEVHLPWLGAEMEKYRGMD